MFIYLYMIPLALHDYTSDVSMIVECFGSLEQDAYALDFQRFARLVVVLHFGSSTRQGFHRSPAAMSTIVEARNARFVSRNDTSLGRKPFVHFVHLMSPQPHGIPFGLQVVLILVLLPLLVALLPFMLILLTLQLLLLLLLLLLVLLSLLDCCYYLYYCYCCDYYCGVWGTGIIPWGRGVRRHATSERKSYSCFLLLHQFEYCPAVSDSC